MKNLLPIFPLNGAILFPETNLPLNIFEERYIDMVNYALANQKKIGMIQTRDNNDLYQFGCLGKISSFDETNDGRYVINLSGLTYFSIIKEISSDYKFRLVEAKTITTDRKDVNNKLLEINKKNLIDYYSVFIKDINPNIEINFLNKIDKDLLVKFIAMSTPFSVAEKQMLLETTDINELGKNLEALFQLYLSKEKGNDLIN